MYYYYGYPMRGKLQNETNPQELHTRCVHARSIVAAQDQASDGDSRSFGKMYVKLQDTLPQVQPSGLAGDFDD